MKVNAICCPKCEDIIYSRARHDYRVCTCGNVFIDGGFDYIRVGGKLLDRAKQITLYINATKKELYDDWNEAIDNYGLIKNDNSKNKKIRKNIKQKNRKKH